MSTYHVNIPPNVPLEISFSSTTSSPRRHGEISDLFLLPPEFRTFTETKADNKEINAGEFQLPSRIEGLDLPWMESPLDDASSSVGGCRGRQGPVSTMLEPHLVLRKVKRSVYW